MDKPNDKSNIDITEINKNLQESFLHYDPNRTDYTINNSELDHLEEAGTNIWKDVFLATLGIGLPCLINGFCELCKLTDKSLLSPEIFINLLIGGICIVVSIVFFFVWQKNNKNFNKLIEQIKNKPKFKLPKS